jgi:(R)-amidase
MLPRYLKISCAQVRSGGDIEKNFILHRKYILKAARLGSDIVCFPETSLSGYPPEFKPRSMSELNSVLIEEKIRLLAELCGKTGISLVFGTARKIKGRWMNMLYFVSDRGKITGSYAKCHLTAGDRKYFRKGGRHCIVKYRGIPIGLQICYDVRFPEWWRLLALKGVKIVINSFFVAGEKTSWKIPVLGSMLVSRAAENGIYVLGINAAGRDSNLSTQIIEPRGIVLAEAVPGRETLVTARIDLSRVSKEHILMRRNDLYEIRQHKNPALRGRRHGCLE